MEETTTPNKHDRPSLGDFIHKSGHEKRDFIKALLSGSNGRTKDEIEYDVVHEMVQKAFVKEELNPYFSMMVNAMADVGCAVDMKNNIVVKKCDPDIDGMLGNYNAEKHQMEICQGIFSDAHFPDQTRAMQTALSYLMVQAFDHCRANVDFKKPEHDLCSVIRATALSGQCSSEIQMINKVQAGTQKRGYQACVLRHSAESFASRHPTYTSGDIKNLVKKVYPSCFFDHSPHDRLPYDEKQAELSFKAYSSRNRYTV